MTADQHQQSLDRKTDDDRGLLSRRSILRRSVLGITGIGVASLLAACGGDEEEAAEGVVEEGEEGVEGAAEEGGEVLEEGEAEVEEVVDEEEEVEVLEISTPTT